MLKPNTFSQSQTKSGSALLLSFSEKKHFSGTCLIEGNRSLPIGFIGKAESWRWNTRQGFFLKVGITSFALEVISANCWMITSSTKHTLFLFSFCLFVCFMWVWQKKKLLTLRVMVKTLLKPAALIAGQILPIKLFLYLEAWTYTNIFLQSPSINFIREVIFFFLKKQNLSVTKKVNPQPGNHTHWRNLDCVHKERSVF